ncbi:hypothetical protein SprV_0602104300 [Sparganum proliferum]
MEPRLSHWIRKFETNFEANINPPVSSTAGLLPRPLDIQLSLLHHLRWEQGYFLRPPPGSANREHAAFANCTVDTLRKSTTDWFHGTPHRYGDRSKRRDSITKLSVSTCTVEPYLTPSPSEDTVGTRFFKSLKFVRIRAIQLHAA